MFGAAAYADDTEALQMKDPLKTHPDCKQRIIYAGGMIPETVRLTGSKFLTNAAQFYLLQQRLQNEIIEFTLDHEKTSCGFFYAIEQLNANDQNAFATAEISRAFLQLHEAQKNQKPISYNHSLRAKPVAANWR